MEKRIEDDIAAARDNYLSQQGNMTRHAFGNFVSAMESTPVFFAVLDKAGKIRSMNKHMLETLGYSVEEVTGQDYRDIFVPDEDRDIVRSLSGLGHQAFTFFCNTKLTGKDGREFLVQWKARILSRYDGDIDYIFMLGSL